jgi:hypothetical protein
MTMTLIMATRMMWLTWAREYVFVHTTLDDHCCVGRSTSSQVAHARRLDETRLTAERRYEESSKRKAAGHETASRVRER